MKRLQNKIALITGAAQGIGLATAELFAKNGAKVLLTDINEEGVLTQSEKMKLDYPDQILAIKHDVTSADDWKTAVNYIDSEFGGINILVNNAGIMAVGTIEDETFEQWKHVHNIDLDSVFLGCKYTIPIMKKQKKGSIINVSSISGIIAGHNLAAYNSAKAGVRHLSKSVAVHCAREKNDIRCNSIHPVFIDTKLLEGLYKKYGKEKAIEKLSRQIPMGKIGEPNDVAFAILYLASDESKFVTGTEIRIDGGISAL
jgi:NAD(P)-dependent dehydrogenase (short-subunit alcohol dehydrogenase family)